MKKILVTGFQPFNGGQINPSEQIVEALAAPDGVELVKLVLPVAFLAAQRVLTAAVEAECPVCILSIGQAGNMPCLAVEQVAINLDSSLSGDGNHLLQDNDGFAPVDAPILPGGPAAYFSTLPVRALVKAVNEAGIPARVSYSAGTYVCNHVMYTACQLAAQSGEMRTGFVHVPFLPEQLETSPNPAGKYSMPFPEMLRGVQVILNELAKCDSKS